MNTIMTELQEKTKGLAGRFHAREAELAGIGWPEMHMWRKASLARFQRAGIPTAKDEEWKYLSLRTLSEQSFVDGYPSCVSLSELVAAGMAPCEGPTLGFVNAAASPELTRTEGLPAGVRLLTLRGALVECPELVRPHLGRIVSLDGKLGSTNDERFVNLNNAFLAEGAFLHVPRGVVVESPIHILFANRADKGPMAVYPRVLVVAEEGSQVKILETHIGNEGQTVSIGVSEVWVGRNAIVEHTRYQDESADSIHIAVLAAHQEADSTYTSNNVQFGAKIGRVDANIWLNGEHTETWLNGAYVAMGEQVLDNHTRIDHAKPNCHSFEVYKGILGDQGAGVFNGKIFVYKDAQKTDAKQTNQALLLSPTATINTKPQLEIFADDVKCTHGATVGQLREDAMFYLRSRGVPHDQARGILVYAFVAEVLEKISIDSVREGLEALLFRKLGLS